MKLCFATCHGSWIIGVEYNIILQDLMNLCFRKESELQQPPLYHLAAKHSGGESKHENVVDSRHHVIRIPLNAS